MSHVHCTESVESDGRRPCSWYDLGRDYATRTIVAPNIEGGVLTGSLDEAERLYRMLDEDIGAHMITWETWTAPQPDYLAAVALPTVHNHGGRLRNMTCPFEH